MLEKFKIIWKNDKYRARILLPEMKNDVMIGTKLFAYFPFLYHCSRVFSVPHIVEIGFFNFSRLMDESV